MMGVSNQQWTWLSVSADGEVKGTDNDEVAQQFALCEDFVVINVKTCQVLTGETSTEEDDEGKEIETADYDLANIAEQSDYNL